MSAHNPHLTSTYIGLLDADLETAHAMLLAIDPVSSLATQLSALGLDDRAVWGELSEATGLTDGDGERALGFSLLWRFGPSGQTARIGWRIQLSRDGIGRTLLSIAIRAQASDPEAGQRITAAWPIVETITREHARGLRRALDEYAADPCDAERPQRLTVLSAAA